MQIILQHFSQSNHDEKRFFDLDIKKPTSLYQLLGKLSEMNPDYYFGLKGVEPFHCISMDGNRIIRPKDDVSGIEKITIVPFVDGG